MFFCAKAFEKAGSCVASGDVDNDNYEDIIVGSPKSDGLMDMYLDAGKATIVYGNTRGLMGSYRDLGSVPSIPGID